jgi:hypothetical protein
MPDGHLVAALLKCATGPPPKIQAAQSDPPLPPNHSPYFNAAADVAKGTADFDLNRTLTPRDLSRRLGECRRQAQRENGQYSLDYTHKVFGSSKFVCYFEGRYTLLIVTFLVPQRVNTVDYLWWERARPLHVLERGAPSRWLGIARSRSDGSHHIHVQPHRISRRTRHRRGGQSAINSAVMCNVW